MSNLLVSLDDFEKHSIALLPKFIRDFYKNGAGCEETLRENRTTFSKYKIRPRFLRNISNINITTHILGEKISVPIGIAPWSMQKMAHPDGECATAKAAESFGSIFILSSLSTTSIEEVAISAPKCIKWFQLYIMKDRTITQNLVQRAEKTGYKALVLTVDTPVPGIRWSDIRNKFHLPKHLKLANFEISMNKMIPQSNGSSLEQFVKESFDASIQWKDILWLKSITKLPIILKGILTAEDAILAKNYGASAIIISNHGGRQLDGVNASLDVLEEINKVVGNDLEIYLDGGIRTGTDVFKALALGSKMVFLGRPTIWGLTQNGQNGVQTVLDIIAKEFKTVLGLSGCASINEIHRNMIQPREMSKM